MKKVLTNLNVYNSDNRSFKKKMILLNENRYQFITQNELKQKEKNESLDLENLNGYYLYPSFTDSHLHLLGTGMEKNRITLADCTSKSELISILSQLAETAEQIILRGWDENRLGFSPDKKFLDKITDKCCLLTRKCGHIAVCNTPFINLLKKNNIIEQDDSDFSSGYLKERTLENAINVIKYDRNEILKMLDSASDHLLKMGITSVHSDDYHSVELNTLLEVLKHQKKIRLFEKINPKSIDELKMMIEGRIFNTEKKQNYFTRIKAVKVYLDGSFGGQTAALNLPYEGTENKGVLYMGSHDFSEYVRLCEQNGLQLLVHVIGDRALDVALKGFAQHISSFNPLRHRLIHVQVANDAQLKLIRELNLFLSIQPVFYDKDYEMAKRILGKTRFETIGYPYKKALELGIELSLSTDSPVEAANPFENLTSALNFMDIKTAFEKYTLSGAKAAFDEKRLGKIEDNYFADGFMLKHNLFELESDKIPILKPEYTLFNGNLISHIQH